MKFKLFSILCFAVMGCAVSAQPDSQAFLCKDKVKLINGDVYVGTITQRDSAGTLNITTWSGLNMTIPLSTIKQVEQECVPRYAAQEAPRRGPRERAPIKEEGWYNATRLAVLTGQSGNGFSLQHSTGYRFSRWVNAGVGFGAESLSFFGEEPPCYPIFGEFRSYLMKGRVSPFVALGAGWGFMGKGEDDPFSGTIETWKGGQMGFAHIGYRFGNYFLIYIGIRMQAQEVTWDRPWQGVRGVDSIVKRRMEIGIGFLF